MIQRLARVPLAVSLVLAALPSLVAQEILHYKFDDACNDKAVNYAAGSPAPAEGTITTNLPNAPGSSWKPGAFGAALTGGDVSLTPNVFNVVDTGWTPALLTGSLTWAAWLRMNPAAATPGLTYVFGTGPSGGFRIFTGGGGFFLTSAWGGANVNTVGNIQTLAKAGWVHLACVLDGTALQGRYYINGVPEAPVTLTSAVNITSAVTFLIGRYPGSTISNIFDLDEFVFANRAMSAAEITAMAVNPRAGDGTYGAGGCGGLALRSSGGRPAIGNALYALTLNNNSPGAFSISVGSNRANFGPLSLPLDLGAFLPQLAGCKLDSSIDLLSIGGAKVFGLQTVPFPIPNVQALAGITLFLQAPAIDAVANRLVVSNAFSIGLGH